MTKDQEFNRKEFVKNALMSHFRNEYKWESRNKEESEKTLDDFIAYLIKTAKHFGIDTEVAMKPDDTPSHPLFAYHMVLEQHIIWCLINKK